MNNRVTGKVNRIWVGVTSAAVFLSDLPRNSAPARGLFNIPKSHQNFNALYSLALSAAINRKDLTIQTTEDITPNRIGTVSDLWVEW